MAINWQNLYSATQKSVNMVLHVTGKGQYISIYDTNTLTDYWIYLNRIQGIK